MIAAFILTFIGWGAFILFIIGILGWMDTKGRDE